MVKISGEAMIEDQAISGTLEWARYYASKGWSVIPLIPGDKRPSVKWEQFQKRRATDEELTEWFSGGKRNIGIVTGRISGLAVVDIDEPEGWKALEPHLGSSLETPIVHTPRKGRHIYYAMPEDKKYGNNARRVPGADFRGEGGYVAAPPSIGANGIPYEWKKRPDIGILSLPEQYISSVLNGVYVPNTILIRGAESTRVDKRRQAMFEVGTRDDDLFHTAYSLAMGGMPREEIVQVLGKIIDSWNDPDPKHKIDKWINDKIDSAFKRVESRQASTKSLTDEVREWVKNAKGVFSSTDVDMESTSVDRFGAKSTRVDKTRRGTISKILSRLVDEGMIVREGKKYGMFRKVESIAEEIKWGNIDTSKSWDMSYPFGLEKYYLTLPKNIIMVDGATDSGKTAFLLNVAYKNAYKYPHRIHYMSSEMGGMELASRIEKFEEPNRFRDVHFWERSENFSDIIRPDDINIIDYLEISDEFWKVGGIIREIHDRLNGGICIIARQKLKGAKSGRGGDFGKEKARMVLLMDPGELTIDKCKNWRNPTVNPNNKIWKFKLVNGCRFIASESNAISEVEL